MIVRYKFESSDVIRTYNCKETSMEMDKLIQNILKDIFGDQPTSCYLEPLNMEHGQVYEERMNKVLEFKRTYKQKFSVKMSKPKTVDVPVRKKVIVRKRRWKSPKQNWGKRIHYKKRRWVENGR